LIRVVAFLFSLLLPVCVSAQTFDEVKELAEGGSRFHQSFLASMYESGVSGVPQDLKKAAEWYVTAAEDGDPERLYLVGRVYDQGIGVPQDLTEARKWYQDAAQKGYAAAAYGLGYLVARTTKDKVEAYKWFAVSSELNNDPGMAAQLRPVLDKLKSHMTEPEISSAMELALSWIKKTASYRE